MTKSRSFPPISGRSARVLILGSLPGRMSLARGEYYAQPRNAFWRIMGDLFGAGPELPYAERAERLVARHVAVWDVCAAAHRPGSLDTSIDRPSVEPNDFEDFFMRHPSIQLVGHNGSGSAQLFERFVRRTLTGRAGGIPRMVLPSTSPAHASKPYAKKLSEWAAIREPASTSACCA